MEDFIMKGNNRSFAAIFPHSDDFSIFAGGTMLRLMEQGWTGYFIRLTNDEKDSHDLSIGETIFRIENETQAVAKAMGIRKVYDFNYQNHYLSHEMAVEIRHRLIFLFRLLKIDMVISFNPWGHDEENPDHTVCGIAVEQACWMSGRALDLPELADAGIDRHPVTEKLYVSRNHQTDDFWVDIDMYSERKLNLTMMHTTPMRNMWDSYTRKKTVDTETAFTDIKEFAKHNFVEHLCAKPYCEAFHHISSGSY